MQVVLASSLAALALALAFVVSYAPLAHAAEAACPNEALRAEQGSAYLGDCRAYELVSPPGAIPFLLPANGYYQSEINDHGGLAIGDQASASGGGLGWLTFYPPTGVDTQGGVDYLSKRTAEGWTTEGDTPGQTTWQFPEVKSFFCQYDVLLTASLEAGVLTGGDGSDGPEGEGVEGPGGEKEFCGNNRPPLSAGEPRGTQNLFLTRLEPRSYELVNVTPHGVKPADAYLQDGSVDDSRVVFSEAAPLTPDALPKQNLYESFDGDVRLVSVLPDGESAEATLADGLVLPESVKEAATEVKESAAIYTHAMSSDGSRIFFKAEGNLYVRLHAEAASHVGALTPAECVASTEACSIQVDASQAGGAGGGGKFLAASADGSIVFFVDESSAKLTSDTQEFSLENLYEYDVESGQLTDLTPVAKAKVLGLSAVSEDGSYLYFAAEGVLAPGATSNRPNLYLAHDGHIEFIATVEEKNASSSTSVRDWQGLEAVPAVDGAEASDAGNFFIFDTPKKLSGYDNVDEATGGPDEEVYLYDAADAGLTCVSCDPSGASPIGNAGTLPWEQHSTGSPAPSRLRPLVSDDGTVIFESSDPLVSRDTNGVGDVYEYREGAVHLVSSGTSPDPSVIVDVGGEGEDVFFITTQELTRGDTDSGLSIYDARAGGGFAEPAPAAPCIGEECRGGYSASAGATPSSSTFTGPANPTPTAPPLNEETKKRGATAKQRRARALKACRHAHKKAHARRACERKVAGAHARHGARKPGGKRGSR